MKLYVGTYGKYNNGDLSGAWLDPMDYETREDFFKACLELHKDERDPEIMFQDVEDDDLGIYSEYSLSNSAWQILKACEEISDSDAFAAFVHLFEHDINGKDSDDIVELFNERYFGRFENNYELGEYIANECGYLENVPEDVARYFDFEAFGRDCAFDFHEDGEYYFTAC